MLFPIITKKFGSVLLASLVFIAASAQGQNPKSDKTETKILMQFTREESEPKWNAVNDGVMGGLSKGTAKIEDGILHFSGTLSLENNGGFSSVRTSGSGFDLSAAQSMILRVKGDGRDYQLRLSTNARYRESRISYGATFATKADEWIEVRIPFSSLKPSYRGTKLDGPPLDLSKIEEIGLLIGDKRTGDFSLKVDWIKAE